MQVKFVISALILLAVVVCLPDESEAYVGPPYADGLGTAGEHPWQHEDSPGPGDSLDYRTARIVVFPIGTRAQVIQLILDGSCFKRSGDSAHGLENDHVRKLQFRNKR